MSTTRLTIASALIALPLSASAATLQDLQTQLQSLLSQLTIFNIDRESQLSAAGTAAFAQCPTLTRTLSRGSRGEDVRQLQQFLI